MNVFRLLEPFGTIKNSSHNHGSLIEPKDLVEFVVVYNVVIWMSMKSSLCLNIGKHVRKHN